MSTGVIVAIAVVVVLVLLALLFLLPRMRARKAQARLETRRHDAADAHRGEAERRAARAELAEREARRERAEAELHQTRAQLHEQGLADDELARGRRDDGRVTERDVSPGSESAVARDAPPATDPTTSTHPSDRRAS